MQRLECQREEFSLPPDRHYLNCAYMGPLPRAVQEAGRRAVGRKADPTGIEPADFFEESDRARGLFASLIGAADASRVALIPAVSYGMATIERNLTLPRGAAVVVAAEQFPSNVYAWRRLCRRTGARMVVVEPPPAGQRGAAWNEAVLDAIGPDTGLIALPQVHWTDGTRFDLERIGRRARDVGAAFVIDGTQSIGAHPFDVDRIAADAVVCAGYKWLLGPYGASYAWYGPRFDDGEPLEETWIGREGSEDFRGLVRYRDAYQPGAARYDVGERSNFILLPMAIAGMERVIAWGAESIQAYCARLLEPVIAEARELGFDIEDAAWRGAHLFGLRLPAALPPDDLQRALREHRVYVSLRGSAVRVSPYIYNDAADADALLAALRQAVTGGRVSARAAPRAGP
jgi:selenocysteine lyase/cysteine desulfurase